MSDKKKEKSDAPKAMTPSEKAHLKQATEKAKSKAEKIPKGTFKEV